MKGKILTLICCLFATISVLQAQRSIEYRYDTIIPSYVPLIVGDSAQQAQQKVTRQTLSPKQILSNNLKLNKSVSLHAVDTLEDDLGNKHYRFEQRYNGVRIDGQRYYVHYIKGNAKSMNGNFRSMGNFDANPSITEETALSYATNYLDADEYAWENDTMEMILREDRRDSTATYYPQGELVIWFDSQDNPKLVYKFNILALKPYGSYYVYINAKNGNIEEIEDQIRRSTNIPTVTDADVRFYGTKEINTTRLPDYYYYLIDVPHYTVTRNMQGKTSLASAQHYKDSDNYWTAAEYHANKDDAALTANWAAAKTYDYFFNKFGRKGYDDKNGILPIFVNANFALLKGPGQSSNNGYWDGTNIVLGIGSNEPYVSIDIIAHEIGHAITDYTAEFGNFGESGILNEGFSDIWAVCVQNYALPYREDTIWWFGYDRDTVGFSRNIMNPRLKGRPSAYKDSLWIMPNNIENKDYVHTNSTVLSHWFYILSEGKDGMNTLGNYCYVNGIGIDKAATIAYYTLRNRLVSNSNFHSARDRFIEEAEDRYGVGSAEAIATQNAWYAVGVGDKYIGMNGPKDICSESLYSLTEIPTGSTVIWSGLGLNIDADNDQAYVSQGSLPPVYPGLPGRIFYGETTLKATIIKSNGDTIIVTKQVEVKRSRVETAIQHTPTGIVFASSLRTFTAINHTASDSASLQWVIKRNGTTEATLTGHTISYRVTAGNYTVILTDINGCEPNNTASISFNAMQFAPIILYANPASYIADITIVEQTVDEATIGVTSDYEPYIGAYRLELWSEMYGQVRSVDAEENTPNTQISLSGLTPGTYFIRLIIDGELVRTQQLIIQ